MSNKILLVSIVIFLLVKMILTFSVQSSSYPSSNVLKGTEIETLYVEKYINKSKTTLTKDILEIMDYSMSEVVQSQKWISLFNSLGLPFVIPSCVSSFPQRGAGVVRNAFRNLDTIKVCYEKPTDEWIPIYQSGGNMLVDHLNSRYSLSLKARHFYLSTDTLGFFPTMKAAVDTGICDIITSAVIQTPERARVAHFHCPSGASSLSFLRSELNNTNDGLQLFNTTTSLNDSRVIIVVYGGAHFEGEARRMFPAANFIVANGGYSECFPYILSNQAHVMIGDAVDLSVWLNNHKSECVNCFIRVFGTPYSFGSMTTSIALNGAPSVSFRMPLFLIFITIIFYSLQ